MSVKKGLILFFVALIIFTVLRFPAAVALTYIPTGKLAYQNVQGTLWSGQVQAVQLNKFALQNIHWQFEPMKLFTGQVAYSIKFGQARDKNSMSGRAVLAGGLFGMGVEDAVVRIPANDVKSLSPMPISDLAGRIVVEIDNYAYGQPICEELSGNLSWLQAGVDINGQIDFGMISSDLMCQDKQLVASFDGKNSLGLEGKATIESPKSFGFDGYVKPDESLPAVVHQSVGFFAKQDKSGRYKIKL